MIGARGSLSEVILNAKSAVAYPPYGIDCLIIGNTGVGKTLLAHRMHNYARAVRNGQEVPFMTLYCQNYQEIRRCFRKRCSDRSAGEASSMPRASLRPAETASSCWNRSNGCRIPVRTSLATS